VLTFVALHSGQKPAAPVPAVTVTAPPPVEGKTTTGMTRSAPVRIDIPSIGVSAQVMKLGLNADGTVQVPPLKDHNLAGWYDGSATPGQRGSSVIIGHVDSYTGPSVFFKLSRLQKGAAVEIVRANGSRAIFAVDGSQVATKDTFPTGIVYGVVPYPALRLVTCGGPFNEVTRHYLDNIIVHAHLVSTS
jgi:sortase (surface protein transpeptidase)